MPEGGREMCRMGYDGKRFGTSGVMEQELFGYSSPPEAQGEYVIHSPEIYRATAKCVLSEPSMSTLSYRLNLVVCWMTWQAVSIA